jgi:hypothetical protein
LIQEFKDTFSEKLPQVTEVIDSAKGKKKSGPPGDDYCGGADEPEALFQ